MPQPVKTQEFQDREPGKSNVNFACMEEAIRELYPDKHFVQVQAPSSQYPDHRSQLKVMERQLSVTEMGKTRYERVDDPRLTQFLIDDEMVLLATTKAEEAAIIKHQQDTAKRAAPAPRQLNADGTGPLKDEIEFREAKSKISLAALGGTLHTDQAWQQYAEGAGPGE